MKHTTQFFLIFLFAISTILQWQCRRTKNDSAAITQKFSATDQFSQTGVTSQFFEIKSGESNVLNGAEGTRLAIPENCFLDGNGKPAKGNIKIELAEALDLQSMLQSNLTTTSNGQPIITDGMIYFNATLDGKQLFIDPQNPAYIEIPTTERKSGMMIYQGERNESGNMNWVNPKEPENYLISVDISLLNFYPEGFEDEVEGGVPFGNHAVATKELTDSLYYSIETFVWKDFTYTKNSLIQNEPYYQKPEPLDTTKPDSAKVSTMADSSSSHCGIEPARIKAIETEQFQNTLISTREFETRLKTIFKTCNDQVLDLYVNNLDKNLWEIDEKAHQLLGEQSQYAGVFKSYADQKLTKVNSDKSAMLLKDYYNKELMKIRDELNDLQQKADEVLKKHEQATQQLVSEYKQVLQKVLVIRSSANQNRLLVESWA